MNKTLVYNKLEEFFTVTFLGAGPALGALIAVVWLAGVILGLFALLTR